MKKRIFSIILTTVLLLSNISVVNAENETVVDLIHDSEGNVRSGVAATCTGTVYNGGGGVDVIIDGNDTSTSMGEGCYNSAAPGEYYQIDLGTVRKIKNIKYSSANAGFAGNGWRHMNYTVILSNDENFSTYETVATVGVLNQDNPDILPRHCVVDLSGTATSGYSANQTVTMDNLKTSGSNDGNIYNKAVTFVGTPKYYRYVRVQKTMWVNLCCDEITVMGSECSRNSFGDWTVSDADGERSFSVPVNYENSSNAREFDLTMANYDKDGKLTSLKTVSADGEELSGSIPVTDADEKSIAVAVPKDGDYLFIPPVAAYGFEGFNADMGKSDAFENANTVIAADDYIRIDGKAVSEYDFITAKAVKANGNTAEEAFEGNPELNWYGAAIANNGYSFKVPFSEEGKYYICVSRYPIGGSSEHKYFTFSIVDPQKRNQAIAGLLEADTDEKIKAAVEYAVDETAIVTENTLIDRETFDKTGISGIYTDAIGLLTLDEDATVEEITKMLNTVSILSHLKDGDTDFYHKNASIVADNSMIEEYIRTSLMYSYTADVSSSVPDGSSNVTNVGTAGLITYTFNEEMDASTLNESNIVITENGAPVSYATYKTDKNGIALDKSVFKSDSEYEIVFGSGCKTAQGYKILKDIRFKFKTGEIIDVPYKEGYILKNVSLNKKISDVPSSFAKASAAIDGNKTSFVLLDEDFVIDLGDYYDVCRVNMLSSDEGRTYQIREASIFANCDDPDFKENNILLYKYPFNESELQKLVDLDIDVDDGKIRYFKVKLGPMSFLMREFSAYAYVDTEFGEWTAPEFTGAGTYNFSKAVTENCEPGEYYMILNGHDENGYSTKTTVDKVTAKNGMLFGSITVPTGTVGITAAIVSDLASMEQVTDPIAIGTPLTNEGTKDKGAEIVVGDAAVELKVGLSETIKKSSRVFAEIVSTTESGKTAQEAFAAMTEEDLEQNLIFASSVKCEDGVKYVFDDLNVGKYYIRITVTNIDESVENAYYKVAIVDSTERQNLIDTFTNADDKSLKDFVEDVFYTKEIITYDDVYDAAAFSSEEYYKRLKYTRDMLYPQGGITELKQIIDVLNATAVVHSCMDGDVQKSKQLISKAGKLLGDNFDTDVDVEKFILVLKALKSRVVDGKSMGDVLRRGGMLSYMQNGSNEDKLLVLNKYTAEFGIDLTYPTQKGVSIERVSEYLDCSNVSAYYEDRALNNAFKAAADKAALDQSTPSNSVVGGNSKSAIYGGGGGGNRVTTPIIPDNTTGSEGTQGSQTQELFSDMSQYGWAKEAVKSLTEKNIINGYDDGTFRPDKFVTRAEFVKMLIMAVQSEVVENKHMNFLDVPGDSWYYPYIKIAYTNSLCSGVSEYYFNPDAYITREDMAVMIYNYLKNENIQYGEESKSFIDMESISSYAKEAVSKTSSVGIINGFEDGSFRPKELAKRAEAAMLISKIIK